MHLFTFETCACVRQVCVLYVRVWARYVCIPPTGARGRQGVPLSTVEAGGGVGAAQREADVAAERDLRAVAVAGRHQGAVRRGLRRLARDLCRERRGARGQAGHGERRGRENPKHRIFPQKFQDPWMFSGVSGSSGEFT